MLGLHNQKEQYGFEHVDIWSLTQRNFFGIQALQFCSSRVMIIDSDLRHDKQRSNDLRKGTSPSLSRSYAFDATFELIITKIKDGESSKKS